METVKNAPPELDIEQLLETLSALKRGDFSTRMPSNWSGIAGKIADTLNDIIDTSAAISEGITTVSRVVGREGRLNQRAIIPPVSGEWATMVKSINRLIDDLVHPTTEMSRVIEAVAKGDLSQTMTLEDEGRPLKGQFLRSAMTANTMVEQLLSFASEVTRVAREVGSEGKLGGQANLPGVTGTWRELTDSVNSMAVNLTSQVRSIADVTTAVANGDLSKKITIDMRGEILQLKETINTMVDQLRSFASEVTRVAREVGTEGRLGGQANVPGVAGTWKDLTDNVNFMASNLTAQVRNIAAVTTAVARGDLTKKITVDVKGEILELKDTINVMVDQLSSFASEVTRVAREVGTEGKLGGQASVPGAAGTWKDLTDNVNFMAANLTTQVRGIVRVVTAVANGDLKKKLTVEARGEVAALANTINEMTDTLGVFADQVITVAREVGTEGRLGGQANVPGAAGTWKDLTDNVNFMASNLTNQVRNIAAVTTAVARGDLTKKITVDVKGEILELKDTINVMVDQLSSFASEVTRVAREVGTEGKLGGQAQVEGAAGTWKDLTDNVNFMAANLTTQVRGIVRVVTAVANGDLKKKLTVEARGEVAALANTINEMTDTLGVFADQVITVAREVGVEGKLGGQANVPGAAGTWKDLTENVNQLAANLTTQVRAIAEVSTAVTRGDLSRSIQVEARGEVAELKDNINEMIRNLKETTQKNAQQDWLKTNLARFTRLLQGQRDLSAVTSLILSELAPLVAAHHGVFYMMDSEDDEPRLKLASSYGYRARADLPTWFRPGEGLVGQCALEKQRIWLTNVPRDYILVSSGLGAAPPVNIVVLPILFEQHVKAVIEIASLERFTETHLSFLDQLMESIGVVLNTIEANSRTESLLAQSQSLAQELQQTNLELAEKASLLSEQNIEVERKNREVEQAKFALEEKATQLALSSRYKSEFLANMSHELRTPLNSLLILAQQLSDNPDKNLTEMQVEFAKTIHGSGSDLLTLINDILDLSKIESGTVTLEISDYRFETLRNYVERTFRHMAQEKKLEFSVELDPRLPVSMKTDTTRLQQILKNLLANSFKFTNNGKVMLSISIAENGWSQENENLAQAEAVLAFSVKDTGIGIPADKLQLIFEAFQQVDGSTARKYGGTGLGLSISRELARLLNGEIRVESEIGVGSTFTLYLPYQKKGYQSYDLPRQIGHQTHKVRPNVVFAAENNDYELTNDTAPAAVTAEASKAAAVARKDMSFDDRDLVAPGDPAVLIVGDDRKTAKSLLRQAREKNFKGIVASHADSALPLCRDYQPAAILLDLDEAGHEGFAFLDRLKRDPTTRHIPVHVLSQQAERERALRQGAVSYLSKPVSNMRLEEEFSRIEQFITNGNRRLLIVHSDSEQREALIKLLGHEEVYIKAVGTGEEALALLDTSHFDCVVLSPNLPDMSEQKLLEKIAGDRKLQDLPIVIYNPDGQALPEQAGSMVLKQVTSQEGLIAETSMFLHSSLDTLTPPQRGMLHEAGDVDKTLAGRKVLVIDDDLRNIFALSSVLERKDMKVLYAENGRDGIDILQGDPSIEIVLMDIMMPGMDGYDTMRAIRQIPEFKSLPIITLTAKAMKGDRDKCIAAGASDYITKPVDAASLLSMMSVWLSEKKH
jgi:signal transduction histidine kinase/HAMP domain-containing protein/CheY-like chemotaxis protein